MFRYRWLVIVLLCCCLSTITGCWDATELNKRAIVAGIGIDWKEEEQQYMISFQTIIADEISGKTGRGATPTSIYRASGKTIIEALRNTSRKVPRIISLAHTGLIVISDEVARNGIIDLFDYLDRDSDIRLTTEILVAAEGQRAEDVVAVLTPIGKITAFALVQKIKLTSRQLSENFRVEVDDVIRDLLVPGGGPVINGVFIEGDAQRAVKKSNLESSESAGLGVISNLAIFKGDKLKDWMTKEESKGTVWIKNKMQATPLNIKLENGQGEIALDVMRSKTRLEAKFKDPLQPVIHIFVELNYSIREVMSDIDLRNPDSMRTIEAAANQEVARILKLAVKKCQEANSDILEFGQTLERARPEAWHKMKGRWDVIFPQLEVEYHVKSVVRNSQTRDRSFKYNMKTQ
jgi:spore germination protein KC